MTANLPGDGYDATDAEIATAVEQVKAEVLADIADGIVRESVSTFSELHDFVDANMYGGLCDERGHWGLRAVNRVTGAVNEWLMAGRPAN